MQATRLAIPDVVLLRPKRHGDARGYFVESFNARAFAREVGVEVAFVQDNEALSAQVGTVRGLHFQRHPTAQGKLVRAIQGAIFDVAVDIRTGSPTFGQHVSATLTAEAGDQLWVPPGFAHGYCTTLPDSVYAPYGANFVRTMLRIAGNKPEVNVVADQHGCPTSALDIATTLLGVAARMAAEPEDGELVGVFHMAARGEAVWADVAEAVFAASRARDGPGAAVNCITTAEFPTAARRPANSRLDCTKLERVYGIALPDWRVPLERTVSRLLNDVKSHG